MIQVDVSTVIARPIDEVFAFASDFGNLPRWESDFLEVQHLDSRPVQVGSRYRCKVKMPGRTATSVFTISEYAPPHRIAFTGEPTGPAQANGGFLFSESRAAHG